MKVFEEDGIVDYDKISREIKTVKSEKLRVKT